MQYFSYGAGRLFRCSQTVLESGEAILAIAYGCQDTANEKICTNSKMLFPNCQKPEKFAHEILHQCGCDPTGVQRQYYLYMTCSEPVTLFVLGGCSEDALSLGRFKMNLSASSLISYSYASGLARVAHAVFLRIVFGAHEFLWLLSPPPLLVF